MLRKTALILALVTTLGMVTAYSVAFFADSDFRYQEAPEYDVRILRDTWGVPHIFGKTDADAAYGLAYAHAEDDFITIQRAILATRGKTASLFGKKYAPGDYLVHLLRIWDDVNAKYETDLSPSVRAVCEAYAAGLNSYADLHTDEQLPNLFPVTGKDIVAGFAFKLPLFFGLHDHIKKLFDSEPKVKPQQPLVKISEFDVESYGSNAFAVGPSLADSGKTLLAINSHQPWEGPVTWYEVHVRSEEGWDMTGGVFPATPVILHGHNRSLGWAHTVNKPDLVDVYKLEVHPKNPNFYRFDDGWRELEVRTVPITVKLLGPIKWTVNREVLWSVYGPAVRRPHGTYALRYAGIGEIRQVEQWYRMNKASNLDEWKAAMKMQAVPMFNVGYADARGNIYYVYNALLPIRKEGYDWSGYLPGDRSETLWTNYLPFDDLPQSLNPSSGFIQNCNSTPFRTTIGPDNPDPANFSATFGIDTAMTNRALRALELFGADSSITESEFLTYKYDMGYSQDSEVAMYVERLLNMPVPDDTLAAEAFEVLGDWDFKVDPKNRGAALAVMTLQAFKLSHKANPGAEVSLREAFIKTAHELKDRFGRIDISWEQVNRLMRGDMDLGLGGAPDVLHAVYGEETKDGRLRAFVGDSFVLMVTWNRDGQVHSQSIHQYGSSTHRPNSPHYLDQAPLFAERKLKPVWMHEAEIRQNLEREYRPGEEHGKKIILR